MNIYSLLALIACSPLLAWLSGYHRHMNLFSACPDDPDSRSKWIHLGFAVSASASMLFLWLLLAERKVETNSSQAKIEWLEEQLKEVRIATAKEKQKGDALTAQNLLLAQTAKGNALLSLKEGKRAVQTQEALDFLSKESLEVQNDLRAQVVRLKGLCDVQNKWNADMANRIRELAESKGLLEEQVADLEEKNVLLNTQVLQLQSFINGQTWMVPPRSDLKDKTSL